MKKALSLTLALMMCLSLVPLMAAAVGDKWIQLEKSVFGSYEPFTVTVSGVTAQMEDDRAYVSIHKKGAADNEFFNENIDHWNVWKYVVAGTNTLTHIAPGDPGDYEARLYTQGENGRLITAVPFAVKGKSSAYGNEWIQMAKSNFEPNEEIIAMLFGITEQMGTWSIDENMAEICIYKKGAGHGEYVDSRFVYGGYIDHQWVAGVPSRAAFWALNEPGEYEMRLYSMIDSHKSAETFISSVPFTIGKVAKSGRISIDKTAYIAFEPIKVTLTGITDQMVTSRAYITVCEKGAKHEDAGGGIGVSAGSSVEERLTAPNKNGEFEVRLYSVGGNNSANSDTFVMSVPFTVSGAAGSDWASDELAKANKLGLIPDSLKGKDLTKPITRAEFAAVSVKAYEAMSGRLAIPEVSNPFDDTKDVEVLKAYNVGITTGVSANKFDPDALLNREQAATMLTRVFKRVTMTNWTIQTDGQFSLSYAKPAAFADDKDISGWAKDSVYFMFANGIIKGMGDNKFAPKNVTTSEEAKGYANATREQALIIAVRMVEHLKGKTPDFQ